ncbi:hypothetical protein [Streptomyces camelliae]|uniref:Uncharacterized protein n=1 Tax=Streptomyces camelliae TaxID=3004093 RepID=A0ABY7P8X5_9ACTN|nr:hypothetical protein [Streptomyces sp. HUAS 2-6]WBO66705.1 hypothetical protein O1G22_29845 [Streptomyces sp. HUAS 2-6]
MERVRQGLRAQQEARSGRIHGPNAPEPEAAANRPRRRRLGRSSDYQDLVARVQPLLDKVTEAAAGRDRG